MKFYMEKDLTADGISLRQNCNSGLLGNKPSSNVPCKLNDYRMQGVIDSNVSVCGVNPNIVGKLNVHVEPIQRSQLTTGDGHDTIMLGKFVGVIGLRSNNYPTEIVVMEGLRDVLLLGKEFCIQAHLISSTAVSSVVAKDEKSLKVFKPPEVKEQDCDCHLVQNLAITKDCVNHSSVTKQHSCPLLLENSVTTQNLSFPHTQNVKHDVVLPQLQNMVTKQDLVQVFQKPFNGQAHSFEVSLISPTCIVPCNCPYVQLHPCHCQVEGKCEQCKNTQFTEMDSQVFTIKEVRRIRDKIKRKLNLKKKRKRPNKRKRTKLGKHDVSSTVLVILDSKDTNLIEN